MQSEPRWSRQPTVIGCRIRKVRDQQDLLVVSEDLCDARGLLGIRAGGAGALLTRWDVGHNLIDVHTASGPGGFSAIVASYGTAHSDSLANRAEVSSIPHGV